MAMDAVDVGCCNLKEVTLKMLGFVCFVLDFPKKKKTHIVKLRLYTSNFQPVNSDVRPFREKKK